MSSDQEKARFKIFSRDGSSFPLGETTKEKAKQEARQKAKKKEGVELYQITGSGGVKVDF